MKRGKRKEKVVLQEARGPRSRAMVFWLSLALLVVVPLAFTPSVYRMYVLPRFALLLLGAAALIPLLVMTARGSASGDGDFRSLFKSRHFRLLCLYLIVIAIATAFGIDPLLSLFGTVYNQMGLLTRLCFFVCFVGLVIGAGKSFLRLYRLLWAMAITGLLAAAYACAQSVGIDPFIPASLYTEATAERTVRVIGTLGHSNFLGNFLLYTTLLSVGLGLASRGSARALALTGGALSLAAIAFSGTRGAWVGLVAGALAFILMGKAFIAARLLQMNRRQLARAAAVALGILIVSIGVIALSPASRSVVARARSFVADGLTGSGRTLLWRDSIRMLPDYAVIGAGPESFRQTFLAYKSDELVRFAPQANNESSHNSYLDAALSYGLAGAILYAAVIASALALFIRARRVAATQEARWMVTGIAASFVSVLAHNLFIYDQITTGLYFYAFMALAQIAANVAGEQAEAGGGKRKPHSQGAQADKRAPVRASAPATKLVLNGGLAAGCALVVVALWYAASLWDADAEIRRALQAGSAGNFNAMVERGERATTSPDPTGAYDFLFMNILAEFMTRAYRQPVANPDAAAMRARALDLAAAHMDRAQAHTFTPELNYLLLSYLALYAGDSARLRTYAAEVVRWNPNNVEGRWLLAEGYLGQGNRQQAQREAQTAFDLNPVSPEAKLALARASRVDGRHKRTVPGVIEYALAMAKSGDMGVAQRALNRAVRRAKAPCPDCHPALDQWDAFLRESPDRAATQQLLARINSLREKLSGPERKN